MPPSLALLFLSLLSVATPQFVYPPNVPSDRSLSDYTSGSTPPITDYIIHDAIIGSFRTPKPAFSITRCAQEGRTEPIYPSNDSFNSSQGRVAVDGTWQVMDSYLDNFPNVYSAGKNLWIIPDFAQLVGNATTGHVCWWELYSVSEEQVDGGCDEVTGQCRGVVRVVTLLGNDTENYFASMPFVVQTTMREGNRNYTWGSGGGRDNRASSTTISVGNKPTGNAADRMVYTGTENGGLFAAVSFFGMVLGLRV